MNVFLVDDAEIIRLRVKDIIDSLEHVELVGEATNASDAIRCIQEVNPDVVILDLWLEGTSGIYVLREIKVHLPFIKVIVFTNHDSQEYRKACLQEGANYFLDKTKEFGKLKILLQEILCDVE